MTGIRAVFCQTDASAAQLATQEGAVQHVKRSAAYLTVATLALTGCSASPQDPAPATITTTRVVTLSPAPETPLSATPTSVDPQVTSGYAICQEADSVTANGVTRCLADAAKHVPTGARSLVCSAPREGAARLRVTYSVLLGTQNKTNFVTAAADEIRHDGAVASMVVTAARLNLPGPALPDGIYSCDWSEASSAVRSITLQVGTLPMDSSGQTAVH